MSAGDERPPRARGWTPFRAKPEVEVGDELAFHLEQRVQEYVSRGMTPEQAREAALARFGDVTGVRQECTRLLAEERRAEGRRHWWDDLRQDLRYGVRSALRAPLFTLLAVSTLALGIGANAAVFGVVKSVLLDALPYRDADRVMRLFGHYPTGSMDRGPLSAGVTRDLRERNRSFERIAAFESSPRDAVLDLAGDPRAVKVLWVEPELFRTLGVSPAAGRTLRDEDAQSDTAWNVMLTHEAWERHFGGDPAVVGGTARVNGITRHVVGVLPRDFVGPSGPADFYYPMGLRAHLASPTGTYGRQNFGIVGRLKPGVTPEDARQEMIALAAGIAREQPHFNAGVSINAMPVRDAMVGDTRTPLLVLMASAALVLVITCANLAGALLSRTITRRREFAVRAALGAGQGRLVRQLLAESILLSLAGGLAGVGLAMLGLHLLRGLASRALPPYADLALDSGALLATTAVALLTGIAFGLVPALSASRADVQGTLRDEGRGASESRRSRRLRGVLVAGQIALCVSLLAGAGLLARSLWAMTAAPLGFAAEGLLAVTVQLPPGGEYGSMAGRYAFFERFERRLRAIPGVTAAATSGDLPTRVGGRNGITPEGAPALAPGEGRPFALFYTVSDDYFRTMGMVLKRGRAFGPQDHAEAPPVLVISEGMARKYWPGEDAVGKRLQLGPPDAQAPWFTVVGIVGDVANDPAKLAPEDATYMPMRQAPYNGPVFLVRTAGDPAALVPAVRGALAEEDRSLPIREAMPMRTLIADGLSGRRLPVLLMTAFGALALMLASVGVYAMFASMAAAREREFGVRMALGSTPAAIARLVLRQGGAWMAAGLLAGGAGVVLVSRALRGLLHGVAPFDPVALGAAVLLLVAAGVVALMLPVRRATRVDPVEVLR